MKYKIAQGDCLAIMKKLPNNCIDTIITDPPYGLSFMGKRWDYAVPSIKIWKECLRILKYGGTALIFAGARTQHRMAVNVEDAGFVIKDCIMWIYGSGFPKAVDIKKHLIKKGSLEADRWAGWKSHGLKPAYEPIIVAMKPNDGSYANNALKYGVAGLNIDEGRIPYETTQNPATNPLYRKEKDYKNKCRSDHNSTSFKIKNDQIKRNLNQKGRYPANVIFDEEAAEMLDKQSGILKSGNNCIRCKEGFFGEHDGLGKLGDEQITYGDMGRASRFFYCVKASFAERNMGCGNLPLNEPSYGKNMSSSNKGTISGSARPTKNNHPTVKPLNLMEYLCVISKTPFGGIVLDPFAGSGTTGIAAINTGRPVILIEQDREYIKIMKERMKNVKDR